MNVKLLSTTSVPLAPSGHLPGDVATGSLPRAASGTARRLPKDGLALSSVFRADRGWPMESLAQRCAARRERIVVHRAKDHTDADRWDLEFWQNQTPEMRLLALMELRNDLSKVRGRNRMFDDE